MTYESLLKNAPPHDSEEFLQYLRDHNKLIYENDDWLVIRNVKYGWPTAFAKHDNPRLGALMQLYRDNEWKVKPVNNRTVARFHIHIVDAV